MTDESMYTSYRWLVLLVGALAITSVYINMTTYAPILGNIAKDLQVNMGNATDLMMIFVLGIACVLIWGGTVCDKYGLTTALVLGLLCSAIPATFMPWIGQSYGLVYISRFIQGASVGFVFGTIGPITALWFPKREQGIAGGVLLGSLSLGSAIGAFLSPRILEAVADWKLTMTILTIPAWIGLILALIITRRPPSPKVIASLQEAMQSKQRELTFGKALTLPMTWVGAFIIFFNAWGLYCLYNLVPAYLAAKEPMGVGLGPILSGQISLAVTCVGIFAPLIGGFFFDKITKGNPQPAVFIGFILTGLFAYLILTSPIYQSVILLVSCLLLAGFVMPFMNPSLSTFITFQYPPHIVASMVGFWFGFGTFGGALGLFLGGKAINYFGTFFWSIAMISIAAFIGIILNFFLLKTKRT